jgi:hypothetical protein
MIARRLKPGLTEHLTGIQYCGVPRTSILDAVTTIRYMIAHAGQNKLPMCVLSLDFANVFDRISHELFKILAAYGIEDSFLTGIHSMYAGTTSSIQINGHSHGPITIRSAVRKACPMSMALYAL